MKQEPTTMKQEPTTMKKEPTTMKQEPTTMKKEPTTERQTSTEKTTESFETTETVETTETPEMTTKVPEVTTFENVVVTTEVTKETEFGIRLLNVTDDSAIIVMTTNDDVITVTLLFMADYLNEPIENRLTVFKRINNIKLSPLPPNSDFTMKAIFYLKDGSSVSKEVTFQSARVGPATTQQPTTQVQMTDFDIRAANVTSDDAIVVVAVTDDVTKVSLTFYEDGIQVGSESVFRDLNPVSRIRLHPLMPGTPYKMVANFYFKDNRVRQKQAEFVTLGREGVETTPSTQEDTTVGMTTTTKLMTFD